MTIQEFESELWLPLPTEELLPCARFITDNLTPP